MIDHVAYLVLERAAGASRTPEAALSVLNVLPAVRSPLTLAAVLSRGFTEFRPELAVMHGHAPALLPHYPPYILFTHFDETMAAAINLGHLPTFCMLWKVAGPNTCARAVWARLKGTYVAELVLTAGHVDVADWLGQVTADASLELYWHRVNWEEPAEKGHFRAIIWALERGLLRRLTPSIALASASLRDVSFLHSWLADQPDTAVAIAALKLAWNYPDFLKNASIGALEWWWTDVALETELPEPSLFNEIVEDCFLQKGYCVP